MSGGKSFVDNLKPQNIIVGYKPKDKKRATKEEPLDLLLVTKDAFQTGNVIGIHIDYPEYGKIIRCKPEVKIHDEFIEQQKNNGWEFIVADNINELGKFMLEVLERLEKEFDTTKEVVVATPVVEEV